MTPSKQQENTSGPTGKLTSDAENTMNVSTGATNRSDEEARAEANEVIDKREAGTRTTTTDDELTGETGGQQPAEGEDEAQENVRQVTVAEPADSSLAGNGTDCCGSEANGDEIEAPGDNDQRVISVNEADEGSDNEDDVSSEADKLMERRVFGSSSSNTENRASLGDELRGKLRGRRNRILAKRNKKRKKRKSGGQKTNSSGNGNLKSSQTRQGTTTIGYGNLINLPAVEWPLIGGGGHSISSSLRHHFPAISNPIQKLLTGKLSSNSPSHPPPAKYQSAESVQHQFYANLQQPTAIRQHQLAANKPQWPSPGNGGGKQNPPSGPKLIPIEIIGLDPVITKSILQTGETGNPLDAALVAAAAASQEPGTGGQMFGQVAQSSGGEPVFSKGLQQKSRGRPLPSSIVHIHHFHTQTATEKNNNQVTDNQQRQVSFGEEPQATGSSTESSTSPRDHQSPVDVHIVPPLAAGHQQQRRPQPEAGDNKQVYVNDRGQLIYLPSEGSTNDQSHESAFIDNPLRNRGSQEQEAQQNEQQQIEQQMANAADYLSGLQQHQLHNQFMANSGLDAPNLMRQDKQQVASNSQRNNKPADDPNRKQRVFLTTSGQTLSVLEGASQNSQSDKSPSTDQQDDKLLMVAYKPKHQTTSSSRPGNLSQKSDEVAVVPGSSRPQASIPYSYEGQESKAHQLLMGAAANVLGRPQSPQLLLSGEQELALMRQLSQHSQNGSSLVELPPRAVASFRPTPNGRQMSSHSLDRNGGSRLVPSGSTSAGNNLPAVELALNSYELPYGYKNNASYLNNNSSSNNNSLNNKLLVAPVPAQLISSSVLRNSPNDTLMGNKLLSASNEEQLLRKLLREFKLKNSSSLMAGGSNNQLVAPNGTYTFVTSASTATTTNNRSIHQPNNNQSNSSYNLGYHHVNNQMPPLPSHSHINHLNHQHSTNHHNNNNRYSGVIEHQRELSNLHASSNQMKKQQPSSSMGAAAIGANDGDPLASGDFSDTTNGLSNIALAFIFVVSLITLTIIAASMIYRHRRRSIARCADLPSRSRLNLTQRTRRFVRSNFTGGPNNRHLDAASIKSINMDLASGGGSVGRHNLSSSKPPEPPKVTQKAGLKAPEASVAATSGGKSVTAAVAAAAARNSCGMLDRYTATTSNKLLGSQLCPSMSTFNAPGAELTGSGGQTHSSQAAASEGSPPADIKTLNTRLQRSPYLKSLISSGDCPINSHQSSGRRPPILSSKNNDSNLKTNGLNGSCYNATSHHSRHGNGLLAANSKQHSKCKSPQAEEYAANRQQQQSSSFKKTSGDLYHQHQNYGSSYKTGPMSDRSSINSTVRNFSTNRMSTIHSINDSEMDGKLTINSLSNNNDNFKRQSNVTYRNGRLSNLMAPKHIVAPMAEELGSRTRPTEF